MRLIFLFAIIIMIEITNYEALIVKSKLPDKINVCARFSFEDDSNIVKGTIPPYLGDIPKYLEDKDTDLYSQITIGSLLIVKGEGQFFEGIKCLNLTYKGETLFKGTPPYVGVSFAKYLIATVNKDKTVSFTFER